MKSAWAAWLTHQWILKLLSLALAVILWAYILGEQTVSVEVLLPLEIESPANMVVVDQPVRQVRARLRGSSYHVNLTSVGPRWSARPVLPKTVPPGPYTFTLAEIDFQLPRNVRVVSCEPATLTITVDRLLVRSLPVQPQLVGEPAEGYRVQRDKVTVNPDTALVTGPEMRLKEMEAIRTVPINVVGQRRTFYRRVPLESLMSSPPPEAEQTLIEVVVPIEEDFGKTTLTGVPVKYLNSSTTPWQVVIQPPVLDVVLVSAKAVLDRLDPKNVVAYVDISQFKQGEYTLPVKFLLPPDVSLGQDAPSVVVSLTEPI